MTNSQDSPLHNPQVENLQEILKRVSRIETRLVQFGDFVGANLRDKQRIDILEGTTPAIVIDALDVSLSRIAAELQRHQIHPQAVGVWLEGRLVATLYPKAMINQPIPRGQQ